MLGDRMSDSRELARMWQAALGRLEVEITPSNFDTWLRHTRALRIEGTTILVEAVRSFDLDHLNERLSIVVQRAVARVSGVDYQVRFVAPRGSEHLSEGSSEDSAPDPHGIIGAVNANHTFDRYLPATGNRLAYQCVRSLLDDSDHAVSPIVVFGSPGMGKTHLLHALAGSAAQRGWPVACMSAEEFTNRYQAALRRKEAEEFQSVVRGVRLLIIDDLQYLSGKRGTQDELVHTFDAVTNAGGYVAIGSERHPDDLDLPERLSSRLSAGVATRVEPFLLEERRCFIEHVAREMRVALPAWALDRIAQAEVPSVRALQGALHAAMALARANMLDMGRLDASLMRVSLAEVAPACGDRSLIEAVARHFGATFEDVVGRNRKRELGVARAVTVAALRERGRSLSEIAELLDGRDKSTISPLADRGRDLLSREPRLRAIVGAA